MRDQQICELYRNGATQRELSERYELSVAWIGHILRKGGIKTNIRTTPKTDRVAFTGVLLTKSVKEALKIVVKQEGTSMSAFIADLVLRELKQSGVVFQDFSNEEELDLPYESTDHDV